MNSPTTAIRQAVITDYWCLRQTPRKQKLHSKDATIGCSETQVDVDAAGEAAGIAEYGMAYELETQVDIGEADNF